MTRSEHDTWDTATGVGATATGTAAVRAVFSRQPDALVVDPFASALVERAGIEEFAALSIGKVEPSAVFGDMANLLVEGMAIRTKSHDEYLLDRTAHGFRQVVMLASGLDTRAYRLNWPAGTTVFDLDQQSVIEFKTATLADLNVRPTCAHHRPVSADLRYGWPAALTAAGFDTQQPTLWFVEGLLPYLLPPAQDALLDNITTMSARGSAMLVENLSSGHTSEHNRFRTDLNEVSKKQNFDIGSLMYDGDRHETSDYLQTLGWTTALVGSRAIYEEAGRALPVERLPFLDMLTVRATLD